MTDASANNQLPSWGPQGQRIYFTTDRSGAEEIVSMPADGGEIETLHTGIVGNHTAHAWSPDGRYLAINVGPANSRDIWLLDTSREGAEARPFLATRFYEGNAVFSPDGHWLTFGSDESGRREVYASPIEGGRTKIQLSTGGGFDPRWREDGAELFYQTESALVAVPIEWTPAPRPGRPQPAVETFDNTPLGYDVSRDGKYFYVIELDESRWRSNRIDVVSNWFAELRKLAGSV